MNTLVTAGSPVFVELPADLAMHRDPHAEIWYVTGLLTSGTRRVGLQVMITTSPSGKAFTSLSLTDSETGTNRHSTDRHDVASMRMSTEELDIDTGNVTLAGPTEAMRLSLTLNDDRAELLMQPAYPVMYNCGTGVFPYFSGPTHQFALPGLKISGSVTLDGSTVPVEGSAWFDRQWSTSRDAFGTKHGFTWFGLWLDDGHALSVWDTTDGSGVGKAWATVVSRDGTHTVTAMTPVARLASGQQFGPGSNDAQPECWVIELPGMGGELEVTHESIHVENRFYSGLCTVSGRLAGNAVTGHGVVDTVAH